MKNASFIHCFLLTGYLAMATTLFSQKKESYYDYQWKPSKPSEARFYSTVEKTDSGWLRQDYFIGTRSLQMKAVYEDEECKKQNGWYAYFHPNGMLSSTGRRLHGKREGLCLKFHSNGFVADSGLFLQDRPVDIRLRWFPNGMLADSLNYLNDSMHIQLSWYDDGSISEAGYWLNDNKYGKWKYYHKNNNPAGEEIFDRQGKMVSSIYYHEDGTELKDTSKANREARFRKGGIDGWTNYLYRNLEWPRGYEFIDGDNATVVVSFVINEEGKPENVEITVPFFPEFDKIALSVVENSPTWEPALKNNRRVKSYFQQPVTFFQR